MRAISISNADEIVRLSIIGKDYMRDAVSQEQRFYNLCQFSQTNNFYSDEKNLHKFFT